MNENVNVEELINELVEASEAYYSGDVQLMSDDEFDGKQLVLMNISKDSKYAEFFAPGTLGSKLIDNDVNLGADINIEDPIPHTYPMLSLGKAKTEDELNAYLKRVSKYSVDSFNLEPKLDGMSLSAIYTNGTLTTLASRGRDNVGENLTYLMNHKMFTIVGLPYELPTNENVIVRGEVYFNSEQYAKVNKEQIGLDVNKPEKERGFKNSRNALAGLVKRAKLGLKYPVEATLASYIYIVNDKLVDMPVNIREKLFTTYDLFDDSYRNIKSISELTAKIEEFGNIRDNVDYPTDGIVIKPTETGKFYELMGVNSHHPISQVAWKYPAERKISTILDIVDTVGKTGVITPVANIEGVMLEGSLVENASLANYSIVEELNVNIGDVILVEKSNSIIPKIVALITKNSDGYKLPPTECPTCGSTLVRPESSARSDKTILCPNEDCDSRVLRTLVYAVKKEILNIKEMSESTLNSLFTAGIVKNIVDLYKLDEETLSNVVVGKSTTGKDKLYGKTRAKKVLKAIEESKSLPLERVLPALNIENLGKTTSKELAKVYPTLDALKSVTASRINAMEGFGVISAETISNGLKAKMWILEELQELGFNLNTVADAPIITDELASEVFSISGTVPSVFSNRNELVEYIENHGGVFNSSPNKKNTYMIGDTSDSSSKIKKAISLNIPFLSPEEFVEKFYVK